MKTPIRPSVPSLAALLMTLALTACSDGGGGGGGRAIAAVGDEPVIAEHLDQADLEAGRVAIADVIDAGRELFAANFNTLDGAGRPETGGTGLVRARREAPENFNRVSAPDANSCAGCHNLPFLGGGGDNVANVFVMGQRFPFVNFDATSEGDSFQQHFLDDVANERNTLGMFGAGFIELLSREMTVELQAIRASAVAQAQANGTPVTLPLAAKGVSFGTITSSAAGVVDTSGVQGIDANLVLKPFHQKGVVVSLREFTNNAMNHHHGMQSSERFGAGTDHDKDGHLDELTVGDVTATAVFQATLPAPGRVLPNSMAALAAVNHGESLFQSLGCAVCHVPELVLDDPVFTEPGPFNPPGNLQVGQVAQTLAIDLTSDGPGPHLAREADGTVIVRAFTDLKRHDMGPDLGEALVQAGVSTTQFLTRKLWGCANEPPFMHHGRALTLSEAILMHAGEAQAARDAFAALSAPDQQDVVEFLKTLQVLPPDAASNEILAPFSGVIGDEPAVLAHLDQTDVEAGLYSPDSLFNFGQVLFKANFNTLDGAGRPETGGTGLARPRREAPENFNRVSAPDANSCAGCHNIPRSGGGGDNVANVFVMGQRFPFVNFDATSEGDSFQQHFLDDVANERNTLGMFGAGFIELLSREMTVELQSIRASAVAQAQANGAPVTLPLVAKGVSFGTITSSAAGAVDTSGVQGIDASLVLKPFHQKGVVVSLREFTNNATNHHHGMQSRERFGAGSDLDNDGHLDELTEGDITAMTLYQAMLAVPGRVLPSDPARQASVDRGEDLFDSLGCAVCHVPALRLEDPVFTEPNPFNPAGNLQVAQVGQTFAVDLTAAGIGPHLGRETDGSVLVPAFTDLKRHDMGPALNNEALVQAGVPTNQFITRKLWGTANEPPFMHHGRALTIDEAIRMHGGEGQAARDDYAALSESEQESVVDFLKTLQVLPENSPLVVVE